MVRWTQFQIRVARVRGGSGMSLKMQADINLLQAHYAELEQRLDEMEAQIEMVNRGIHTLVGGGDLNKLRLVREDRMPTPKSKGKKGKIK